MKKSIAQDAQKLLEDPTVKAAFEEIEKTNHLRWRNSPDTMEGYEIREDARAALRGLDLFKDQLLSYVTTGRIAETRKNRQED